ncbi:MAG: DUF2798 domain-containing protein [Candidatus Methanoplasma sp.]|nr:DUF2798 domain-containing protein [Candidatus Methanoplasma sp.]
MKKEKVTEPKNSIKMLIFTGLGMTFFMSLGMSAMMAVINVGPSAFPWAWMRDWCIGFIVALPLAFTVPMFLGWVAGKIGIS